MFSLLLHLALGPKLHVLFNRHVLFVRNKKEVNLLLDVSGWQYIKQHESFLWTNLIEKLLMLRGVEIGPHITPMLRIVLALLLVVVLTLRHYFLKVRFLIVSVVAALHVALEHLLLFLGLQLLSFQFRQ